MLWQLAVWRKRSADAPEIWKDLWTVKRENGGGLFWGAASPVSDWKSPQSLYWCGSEKRTAGGKRGEAGREAAGL